MKLIKCNQVQLKLITITDYDYLMPDIKTPGLVILCISTQMYDLNLKFDKRNDFKREAIPDGQSN